MSPPSIHLEHIGVVRQGRPILTDISWRVAAGSCCAVLGPNGSGKSTLLAVLSGYLWPSSGTVLTTENLSRLFDCRVQVLRNDGRYVASVRER